MATIREFQTICGRLSPDNLLQYVDNFRIEYFLREDAEPERKQLGQYFTPIEVARKMASILGPMPSKVRILDPGAGTGMLSAAAVAHILSSCRDTVKEITVVAYEVDPRVSKHLRRSMEMCARLCERYGIRFASAVHFVDFISTASKTMYSTSKFDIAILNPPYKRTKSQTEQWRVLKKYGLPSSNLYAAFMMLSTILLNKGGRLVSITPRSFCNGPYFLPFRKALLTELAISDIHTYHSRTKTFRADNILQENIILGANKSRKRVNVTITSSDSPLDEDVSVEVLQPDELVSKSDRNLILHLFKNSFDRQINRIVGKLECTLDDLQVSVSTGRVVEFRARKFLRSPHDAGSVPLLLPAHSVNGFIKWPLRHIKKPAAIEASERSKKLVVKNACYVIVKRFSSKEQRKRLSAAVLIPGTLSYSEIGIENHLNYLHMNGSGLPLDLAKGLAVYLNSSFADQYFRLFSGHTQVNANDLRLMKYPSSAALIRFGNRIDDSLPSQECIDSIVAKELGMEADGRISLRNANIEQALEILKAVGLPRGQQNDRTALTLLSLVDIKPGDMWPQASEPLRGITQMMDYIAEHYGVAYAPNTRETIRRYSIHQMWNMGLVVANPDDPERPINSPRYCYQITPEFLNLVRSFGAHDWNHRLAQFRKSVGDSLTVLEDRRRNIKLLPVTLPDGGKVNLTAGGQNELVKRIVEEFCPRFVHGGKILYLGDAGQKLSDADVHRFRELKIELDRHGKAPDVIVHLEDKNWLVLIEAVTSHGPIDQKRHNELKQLFSSGYIDLVFVTAFETRRNLSRYLGEISWETEVWIADSPDHLIHFDGEKFLGPY